MCIIYPPSIMATSFFFFFIVVHHSLTVYSGDHFFFFFWCTSFFFSFMECIVVHHSLTVYSDDPFFFWCTIFFFFFFYGVHSCACTKRCSWGYILTQQRHILFYPRFRSHLLWTFSRVRFIFKNSFLGILSTWYHEYSEKLKWLNLLSSSKSY